MQVQIGDKIKELLKRINTINIWRKRQNFARNCARQTANISGNLCIDIGNSCHRL